jgi:sRNA-binding protein
MSEQNLKEKLDSNTQESITLKEEALAKEREIFEEVKNWLEATYPKAFDFKNPIPLKSGVRQELMAKDSPFSEAQLYRGLKAYVRCDLYLEAIIQCQWRHDLNGNQTEEILEKEREYSKQFLLSRAEKKHAKQTQTSSGDDGVRNSKADGIAKE